MSEWGDLYLDNYYPPDELNEQFEILSAFEIALKSLKFVREKYSYEEIFKYYYDDIFFYQSLLDNINDRCRLMKSYEDYSSRYRKLNPCGIYIGSVKFNYIDPYLEKLKPFFMKELRNCNQRLYTDGKRTKSFIFFVKNNKIFNKYGNKEIGDFYLNNYQKLKKYS